MSPNHALTITLLGVAVELRGPEPVLERLATLFGLASEPAQGERVATVELAQRPPDLAPPRRAVADQVVPRGVVFHVDGVTYVRHHGWAASRFDARDGSGVIHAPREEDLVELGYLMALSRAGIALERRGHVRVHAAAFEQGGRGALFLAPSGGGKSGLVQRLLEVDGVRILGDDVAVIDPRGRLRGFPTSIGVRDPADVAHLGEVVPFSRRAHGLKHSLDSRALQERFCLQPVPLERVYLGRWVSAPPSRARPARRGELARALVSELVVGAGLPQVVELVIPRGLRDAPSQLPSLARRVRAALGVLAGADAVCTEAASSADVAELVLRDLGR